MQSIRLESISKHFGLVSALDNVSLTVEPHEFVTLVGPSGCGKSTLLNMTAGLERLSEGRVLIGDHDVTDLPAGARDIAMVFQSYALYPHLSVRQNLGFPLRVQKKSKAEIAARVREVSDLIEIGNLLDRRPRELSGGQRQRVAIGRAIIRSSSVCLLDEPLSNLDAALRVRMRAELKMLFGRMGTTIMFVTHDQAEAMTMSDRIIVLRDGKVQQQGTPLEVYRNPANIFVATFIGSPQMNILEAELRTQAGMPALGLGAATIPLPPRLATQLASYRHARLLLGLRPEDVTVAREGEPSHFGAKVALVEHLGHGAIIHYVETGLPGLIGLETRDGSVVAGSTPRIRINLDGIRLFDHQDQTAITVAAP
jgi:ABC-type sugar transport system ATPase subunit